MKFETLLLKDAEDITRKCFQIELDLNILACVVGIGRSIHLIQRGTVSVSFRLFVKNLLTVGPVELVHSISIFLYYF